MSKRLIAIIAVVAAAVLMSMAGMAIMLAPYIDAGPTPEQQYVQEVRAVFAHDDQVPDADLIKVGEQVCVALFLKTDERTIVDVGVLNGIAPADMATVIGAARKHLCDQ